jgi:D-3-phosphoglycerate dehydrogenase
MCKILITEQLENEGLQTLQDTNFEIVTNYSISYDELLTTIHKYNCLIVKTLTNVNKNIIENSKMLSCIGRIGVGVDNIDVKSATIKNIPVFFSPHGNTIPTAEHAIGMILFMSKQFNIGHSMVINGIWDRENYRNVQLFGKTLGIIGLGRIGKAVAKRASAFGMKVIAYDPYIGYNDFIIVNANPVSFTELITTSDTISIHTPLTNETNNMINKNIFKLMKSNAILINTARGKIVNENDLYYALKNNVIQSAGLDVFQKEPPINSPLLQLSNCVLTPHIASYTTEAKKQTSIELAQTIKDFLLNKIIKNCINYTQETFY